MHRSVYVVYRMQIGGRPVRFPTDYATRVSMTRCAMSISRVLVVWDNSRSGVGVPGQLGHPHRQLVARRRHRRGVPTLSGIYDPARDLVTFVDDGPGQCSLQADAVVDNYAREVLSVQTKSRRGRLPVAPTCQSGPPTLLAVVASALWQAMSGFWVDTKATSRAT